MEFNGVSMVFLALWQACYFLRQCLGASKTFYQYKMDPNNIVMLSLEDHDKAHLLLGAAEPWLLRTAQITDQQKYLAATIMQGNQNNDYKDKPFADGLLQGGMRIFLPRCPKIYAAMLEHERYGGAADYASNITLVRCTGQPAMVNRIAALKFGIGWEDKTTEGYKAKIAYVAQCLREFGFPAYEYPVKNGCTTAVKLRS